MLDYYRYDDDTLRAAFGDHLPLPSSPPLRLGPPDPRRRHYRVLFAPVGTPPGPRRLPSPGYGWSLRPVGPGPAWALDVTVDPTAQSGAAIAATLDRLTGAARRTGLLPITTERFA
ncbi:hypothetical protein AMIS_41670 [Actinoplanes missouriensis 431]|uniref:Uncharacterized protein n=1 Tax=Actinoplanes missouriensis (strain ATCC 14538 / DSM 43046 / CBS 188.64 / JCM 3121 / NBRC 102363 / NCIMB 12654 / NRRL B-3342 / UNCC 431) TaxID=512565 RepID=I0H8Q0_ACTM4|nr:hypothetical protein [Actinoplanes missouriensis]BAL89387.1 hypothetical protein AMIS_41670 [Actinoplanes missouriensis 431]